MPALCPRIRLRITDTPITTADRAPGTGSLDQVREDLGGLETLGAQYVVLDWYNWPDLEGTRDHERAFAMLATLASDVLDLANEQLR